MHLLDSNVLIDANRDYYSISRVPEFWNWLVDLGARELVKIPLEMFEEIKDGDDDLGEWIRQDEIKGALLLHEEADVALVSLVTNEGYAPDLTDDEIEKIGRDPFLVAYGLGNENERCIVTTETSRPSRRRANRHVPDVCSGLGVRCCNTFEFVREFDFTTNWKLGRR